MSDPTNPTSTTPAPAVDPALAKAIGDLGPTLAVIKDVLTAAKTGGAAGALQKAPEAITQAITDVEDAVAAVPAIKAGYKTTEFWLGVLVVVAPVAYAAVTGGKTLPFDVTLVAGGVVAVYTAVRGLLKHSATTTQAAH